MNEMKNTLDGLLASGALTQEEYDAKLASLNSQDAQVASTPAQAPSPVSAHTRLNPASIVDIVGIAAGAVLLFCGISVCVSRTGLSLLTAEFGADFYTYVYDGIYEYLDALGLVVNGIGLIIITLAALLLYRSARNLVVALTSRGKAAGAPESAPAPRSETPQPLAANASQAAPAAPVPQPPTGTPVQVAHTEGNMQ